jgi:hypothetical protein
MVSYYYFLIFKSFTIHIILEIIKNQSAVAHPIDFQIYQYKNQQTTTKKYQIFSLIHSNKKKLYIQINDANTGNKE